MTKFKRVDPEISRRKFINIALGTTANDIVLNNSLANLPERGVRGVWRGVITKE